MVYDPTMTVESYEVARMKEGEGMSSQQHTLMRFDPATGQGRPYPSHAAQWREYNGPTAWLFNPWTGDKRSPLDVGSDVFGHLILPPEEPIYADLTSFKGVREVQT